MGYCMTRTLCRTTPGLRILIKQCRRAPLATLAVDSRLTASFRTEETNPANHSELHEAQFYTIRPEIATKLFILGGFDKEQQLNIKTFRETAIMVRKPALEVMGWLKRTDFSRPVNRYIIHGGHGTGKTYTLNHLVHYGFSEKFILLYCPTPTDWTQWPEETSPSTYKPETRYDTPIDSAVWLQHFKSLNSHLLEEYQLTTSKKYTWSIREVTEQGEPLANIIEHGINRIKHASDCAAVIMKEIKDHARAGRCKTLVIVDRVNTFFENEFTGFFAGHPINTPITAVRYPDKRYVPIREMTICRAFMKLLHNDWNNGAVIATVDKKLHHPFWIAPTFEKEKIPYKIHHLSDKIIDLIKHEGFKVLDPFIPVEVNKLTEKEMQSLLDYYIDRKWIQRPEAKTREGLEEIKFLSGFNALEVYNISRAL